MWTCPDCGRSFTRNKQSHSCEQYDLDSHFMGKPKSTRILFDYLVMKVAEFGRMEVYPGKYHITFRNLSTFASIMIEKEHLTIVFISLKPIDEFPVYKNHLHTAKKWSNVIKIEEIEEIDTQLLQWLKQARELAI